MPEELDGLIIGYKAVPGQEVLEPVYLHEVADVKVVSEDEISFESLGMSGTIRILPESEVVEPPKLTITVGNREPIVLIGLEQINAFLADPNTKTLLNPPIAGK